jgi:hypothetical protein
MYIPPPSASKTSEPQSEKQIEPTSAADATAVMDVDTTTQPIAAETKPQVASSKNADLHANENSEDGDLDEDVDTDAPKIRRKKRDKDQRKKLAKRRGRPPKKRVPNSGESGGEDDENEDVDVEKIDQPNTAGSAMAPLPTKVTPTHHGASVDSMMSPGTDGVDMMDVDVHSDADHSSSEPMAKRKRGRPRKYPRPDDGSDREQSARPPPPPVEKKSFATPKGRPGRKPKKPKLVDDADDNAKWSFDSVVADEDQYYEALAMIRYREIHPDEFAVEPEQPQVQTYQADDVVMDDVADSTSEADFDPALLAFDEPDPTLRRARQTRAQVKEAEAREHLIDGLEQDQIAQMLEYDLPVLEFVVFKTVVRSIHLC